MNATQPRSFTEPRRLGLIAIIVAIVILLMALGLPRLTGEADDAPGAALDMERRQVMDPPKDLADFTLTNQDGEAMSLSDLQGQPTLLFFGFTHCPDICPTTLAEYRLIKRELGELGNDVQFVMVSVDGSRDTPETLKAYVGNFDPEFIGLTGDEDEVRQIGGDYFLYFNRAATGEAQSAAGYLVDHTTYSYLIDAEGRLRTIYPFQAERDMIVRDIGDLITAEG